MLTYDLLKAEIDAYLDVKHAAALAGGGGATPMDLDTFHKGKKAKGGKKGGGKGNKQQQPGKGPGSSSSNAAPCKHCKKALSTNHTEWYCWFNPKNNSPEAIAKRAAQGGAQQPSGKGGKGKKGKKSKKGKGGNELGEGAEGTTADAAVLDLDDEWIGGVGDMCFGLDEPKEIECSVAPSPPDGLGPSGFRCRPTDADTLLRIK